MGLINSAFRKFFEYSFPSQPEDIFQQQKDFLSYLLENYNSSPLYINSSIKQEDVISLNATALKNYLSQYSIIEYKTHIYPLVQQWKWITQTLPDLHLKTSGTSDAYQGGKLIPIQRKSLKSERFAIEKTLYHYLWENPESNIFFPYSFSLTAPFDETSMQWYISWALRLSNSLMEWMMFPSQEILLLHDYNDKKEKILEELFERTPTIRSFHGVPAWPLSLIDELMSRDKEKAKEILSQLEYVSIGGWAPQDYKNQYQERLSLLWLDHAISWSNNHNASEWFFGTQIRKFSDLSFHRMLPVYETNFFLFIPQNIYKQRKSWEISVWEAIRLSDLLHEVRPAIEYFMIFANDRIPRLYDIKDRVVFFKSPEGDALEYEVVWRYSMSSNLMNEHIESDVLQDVLQQLVTEWYAIDKNSFVAGIELSEKKTSGIFHIMIEGELPVWKTLQDLNSRFDFLMGEYNTQRKNFRAYNEKITDSCLVLREEWFIRTTMMKLWLAHEQSKIPYLSDHNYLMIVKPLLEY